VSEIPSLWESLPCGCKATACDTGWQIEAEAFLCEKRHKQGSVLPRIDFDEIDENAERIRSALRKLDALDPDRSAAGEALGFFIHKARKGTSDGARSD
jgi:hypothetical protein